MANLEFGLGLCFAGIGGARLIFCRLHCRHFQFPTKLHWLSTGVALRFLVVLVFDKVEKGVLHFLEVFIKTDSGPLVGKRVSLIDTTFDFHRSGNHHAVIVL